MKSYGPRGGVKVQLKEEIAAARARLASSTFYQKFEQIVVLILSWLIAIVVVFAVWNLTLKIFLILISGSFDPTDYEVSRQSSA
jgi:hypothetical protein